MANTPSPQPTDADADTEANTEPPGRFSLHNLSAAFARLTSSGAAEPATPDVEETFEQFQPGVAVSSGFGEVLSPRMIVEAMLFVGYQDGRPLTNREIAATIRDVSPREVDAHISELNACYRQTGTAYEIAGEGAGYRMRLRDDYEAVRKRFDSRVREAKLTRQAIEVLSVVAYRQPVTSEEVSGLRGTRSHGLLNNLVRRGLLHLDRASESPKKNTYHTTDRFNRLFRVDSPADLPSSAELDDR